MNPDAGQGPNLQAQSESAKSSLALTQTLFRAFVLTVLGSFFVYTLNVSLLWLSAVLTLASLVLGIVVLVQAARFRQSKLVVFGTISGLIVTAVMGLLLVFSAFFFNQIRDYQDCARPALTEQARSDCQQNLVNSLPPGLR